MSVFDTGSAWFVLILLVLMSYAWVWEKGVEKGRQKL